MTEYVRDDERDVERDDRYAGTNRVEAVRERQRERFGGMNIGATFFGWLVAVGMAVLLTALLSAAGTAVAISELSTGEASANADTIGIAGAIGLIVIALISYFAGGYVAGRMSRFDGARQGLGVWLWAVLIAVVLAVIGVIAGEEWNVFAGLDLPRLPIDEDATAAGIVVLVLILGATLLAAIFGGKIGENYHRRVDREGLETDAPASDRRRAVRTDRTEPAVR
jgi:hypothetical protein